MNRRRFFQVSGLAALFGLGKTKAGAVISGPPIQPSEPHTHYIVSHVHTQSWDSDFTASAGDKLHYHGVDRGAMRTRLWGGHYHWLPGGDGGGTTSTEVLEVKK